MNEWINAKRGEESRRRWREKKKKKNTNKKLDLSHDRWWNNEAEARKNIPKKKRYVETNFSRYVCLCLSLSLLRAGDCLWRFQCLYCCVSIVFRYVYTVDFVVKGIDCMCVYLFVYYRRFADVRLNRYMVKYYRRRAEICWMHARRRIVRRLSKRLR